MSKITDIEDGGLTQPFTVDLFHPSNELWQQITHIDQESFGIGRGPLPPELEAIRQILPDFIALLRAHPQVPIKPTTNLGGETPLKLDLLGMYRFLKLKVTEGARLDPERFFTESQRARELVDSVLKSQKPPFNNVDLLGHQQRCPVEIQTQTIDGIDIEGILTATAYAQRFAAVAPQLRNFDIPPYRVYMDQIAAAQSQPIM